MATLRPFRGLRFDDAIVGDLSNVVAPPYDVISDTAREQLYARSPFNVVRLILNRDADPYGAAAATLAQWRAQGALTADATPTLYLYGTRFRSADDEERERFGVIGALRLERFDSGRVRPHERTLEKAKNDRLALLRACRASLSPVFGLIDAPGRRLATLAPASVPEIDLQDETGARHRVWRITDPATLERIAAHFAEQDVFIADGHHRYETALRYRDEMRHTLGPSAGPIGSEPFDHVLAYLTTMEDPGLVILPTHRLLATLPVTAAMLRQTLMRTFTVEDLPWTDAGLATLLDRLAVPRPAAEGAREIRIGAAVRGASSLWLLRASAASLPFDRDGPRALRTLDVTVLHRIVLGGILGLPIGERGGTPGLSYTQDAARALAQVAEGQSAGAFFLPPTDIQALRAVSLAGATMPEKSTFFHPKLLTGLVILPVDRNAAAVGT